MSHAQDRPASNASAKTDTDTGVRPDGGPPPPGRRRRLAVMAAAGLATALTTATLIPATAGAEHVPAALKGPAHPGAAPGGGDSPSTTQDQERDPDRGGDGDGDYWARHAGNPDEHRGAGAPRGEAEGEDRDGGGGRDRGPVVSVECDPNALIEAMTAANTEGGGRLSLAPHCTYALTANDGATGLPVVVQRMVIDGNGATITRAAGADRFRVFRVDTGGDLKLRHLTVSGGKTASDLSGVPGGGGAYVAPGGLLDVDHVTFEGNRGRGNSYGGAIYSDGITHVRNSTFRDNSANRGAGVYNGASKLEITASKFTGNTSRTWGTIATFNGATTIAKSLFKNNTADLGPAVTSALGGTTDIDKSAFLNHRATSTGGAVYVQDTDLQLRRSTVAGNSALVAGGVWAPRNAVIADSKIKNNVATTGEAGGIHARPNLALQRTEVTGNRALASSAGGVYIRTGDPTVGLTDITITDNSAAVAPGGLDNSFGATIDAYGTNVITDNSPTNCTGVSTAICFD
ncbi:hypothetical protein [Streptomyces sp. WMMC905]|uniref:hypothetical protein n=1 Tax=Streptomyces sp. WMMC905 TaxID=3404123 RepID=UPI003B966274